MFCWPCILVWSLQITNLTHSFSCMFISILYMLRGTMCPSWELLYQCDIWFMSLRVYDRLVCGLIRIPDGHVIDAQFFMYVYFYSLHASGNHVPIMRIIVSMWHLVYVTLCIWPSGMRVNPHTRRSSIWRTIFHVCLFLFSACFGQPCAHHHENYCINATAGLDVTLCRWPSGMRVNPHTRRSSTQSDINQVPHWYNNSHDDGHMAARNMQRIEINIHEKLCVKLFITRIICVCIANGRKSNLSSVVRSPSHCNYSLKLFKISFCITDTVILLHLSKSTWP